MKYDGLIGKIGNAIPNNSTTKFAGIGAAVVAPIGAGLSYYENQDWGDAAAGALRSAAFGGILGAAAHRVPGLIGNQIKNSGIDVIDSAQVAEAGNLASTIFKPYLNKINTAENKQILADFNPHVKASLKHGGDNVMFAKSLIRGMDEASDNLSADSFTNLIDLADEAMHGAEKLLESPSGKYLDKYAENVSKQWKGMSSFSKAKNIAAFGTKMGFDSAYGHIVKPTGSFLRGNFTKENTAAFGFSMYGVYEAGSAINSVQQGDYSGAAKAIGMLVGGKLAYGQAANLIHLNNFIKSKNLTWSQVMKGGASWYGLNKFAKGVGEFTPEQSFAAKGIFSNTKNARQPYRDILYKGL